mmetsp:Transcript_1283/g.1522  ORF Transcript_1283/g.1522 Transcript_1283/m.1522 type:complete len:133 (-) Transcript_1283:1054-1452(-)
MNKAQHLAKFYVPRPKSMLPRKVNGKWRSPDLSRRQIADLKKRAYANNMVKVNADWKKGEWDPRWEIPKVPTVMRPPKGTKFERNRPQRMAKIKEALAEMDEKINDQKKRNKKIPKVPYFERILRDQGIIDK